MAEEKRLKDQLKSFWKWLWESESLLSYVVFIILIFIVIKLIFFPLLGLIMGTSLPLAIVESSSMDHSIVKDDLGRLTLCGTFYTQKTDVNYWEQCGAWYGANTNIAEADFNTFPFSNGFNKGDLMIIVGRSQIEVGDVIIFEAGTRHPLIHRVISTDPLATKGDHNAGQLPTETSISENVIVGEAVVRIPYIGWLKLFFVELFS